MKIIKKMKILNLGSELFMFQNKTDLPYITCIARADSITGTLQASSELLHWSGQPASRLIYYPYYQKNPDGAVYEEPDVTENEDNLSLCPDKPWLEFTPEEKERYNREIPIPKETKSISVEVAPGDYVLIWGTIFEEYVSIDDEGVETRFE